MDIVLAESSGQTEITPQTAPEFWALYQQSVLLALKEQQILNEVQLQYCMDRLSGFYDLRTSPV